MATLRRMAASAPVPSTSHRNTRPPIALIAGFGVFIVVLAYLVATSLVRPNVLEFDPSTQSRPARDAGRGSIDTVTIDARDDASWHFLSLTTGTVLTPPDTAGWDLGFRRFHIISSGTIADAGPVPFADLNDLPRVEYQATRFSRDTANPAIARWYRYGILTHLLTPNQHIYLVRTRTGDYAKIEILSYYCPGTSPGCITIRYAFNPSQPSFRSN
jgi:heme-binding HmuY-like protein